MLGPFLCFHRLESAHLDELASTGSLVFAAVNNLGVPLTAAGVAESSAAFSASIGTATGEMVAVSQDTGKVAWDDKLPSTPYGAATVTNNVVFTTTYSGFLYAFNAVTGAILLKTPLSAGSNAPVTVDGDYVIAGAGRPAREGPAGADHRLPTRRARHAPRYRPLDRP